MTGLEIAEAFNQNNDKASWSARYLPNTGIVYFDAKNGLVGIDYQVETGQFTVRFHKLQAAWGDYIGAIGRGLYVVLSALKSAGLPFDAPTDAEEMAVEVTRIGDATFVRWPGAPVPPIMPELQANVKTYGCTLDDLLTQMQSGQEHMQALHDAVLAAGGVWDGMDGYSFVPDEANSKTLEQVMTETPVWSDPSPFPDGL